MSEYLTAKRVQKVYQKEGEAPLNVLRGLDLQVSRGDAVAIVGPSGAGKSTFLHILGTLDRPSLGSISFCGEDLTQKSEAYLAKFRNETIGFVFQFHHLLSEFSALENVAMPVRVAGLSAKQARWRAEEWLQNLGLADRKSHYPSELSGGERQRVAIARALVQRPQILMADEPTGNLDAENGVRIQDLFFQLKREFQLTLLVVTHDTSFAQRFPRRLLLRDGLWVP